MKTVFANRGWDCLRDLDEQGNTCDSSFPTIEPGAINAVQVLELDE